MFNLAETQTKEITVPANASAPVSFLVQAKTLGEMIIHVVVSTSEGRVLDAIQRRIRVLPENIVITTSSKVLIWHDSEKVETHEIILDLKREAIPGTATFVMSIARKLQMRLYRLRKQLLTVDYRFSKPCYQS